MLTSSLPISGAAADINECNNDTLHNCDSNAMCMDQSGTFTCQCRAGYTGTGYVAQDSTGSGSNPGCLSKSYTLTMK